MASIQYKTSKDSRGRTTYFRREANGPWKRVTKREYCVRPEVQAQVAQQVAEELASAGVKDSANFVPKPAPYGEDPKDWRVKWLPKSFFAQPDEPETPAPNQNSASAILREAAGIVEGARNVTHGDKERSFQVIANLWNVYLGGRRSNEGINFIPITAFDVAQMMVLLKIARSIQGTPIRDHAVDAAGYAAIAGEISGGK